MDTPANQQTPAAKSEDGVEDRLALNKDTLRDLESADEQAVKGGAVAETNHCSAFCPSAVCITRS